MSSKKTLNLFVQMVGVLDYFYDTDVWKLWMIHDVLEGKWLMQPYSTVIVFHGFLGEVYQL